jgi:hypothetical protein
MRYRTKLRLPGHLATQIVHPWFYFDVVWIKKFIIKILHTYSNAILVLVEFLSTELHPEHYKSLATQIQHSFL